MATTAVRALAMLTRAEAAHTHIPATEHLASVIARLRDGMLTLEGLEHPDAVCKAERERYEARRTARMEAVSR